MNGWFASFTAGCDALMADVGLAAGVICATLAVLVVVLIALGFGPLRARLVPVPMQRPSLGSASWDGGLLDAWRLYRQLGSSTRRSLTPAYRRYHE